MDERCATCPFSLTMAVTFSLPPLWEREALD